MEDQLEKLVGDGLTRYDIVLMVARRAREIMSGSEPLVEVPFPNPVATAVAEFREGKLDLGKRRR